ncbi:MAG TPA: hypothetical protein VN802_04190 [Stellaceae bacterium]|nr:hypothetical protein [Stellaceae bacterium]
MAAAAARLYSEPQDDRIVAFPGRSSSLSVVPPAMPRFKLQCHWEYCAAERRLVQVWEMRPE